MNTITTIHAWTAADKNGRQVLIGAPAGNIILVAADETEADAMKFAELVQRYANQKKCPVKLVKFIFEQEVKTIDPQPAI